ncbi:MAG: O-antigen translocase [Flavicella sp.]
MRISEVFRQNLLLKMTSLNSVAVLLKMALTFVTQKILAVVLGPSGVAYVGNFKNILPLVSTFSSLGIFNGVIKYVAELKEDKKELSRLLSTSFTLVFIASILVFFVLFFAAPFLNTWIFNDAHDFVYIFKFLAVATPFIALLGLFEAVLSGLSSYKTLVKANTYIAFLTSFLVILMVYTNNLEGALLAMAILPILQLLFFGHLYFKVIRSFFTFKDISWETSYKKHLSNFVLMALFSGVLSGVIDLKLRTYLMNKVDILQAGYWTGMTNISNQYFLLVSAIFSWYVLPKFATITTSTQFRAEVIKIYKTLLPLFLVGCMLLYFGREWVIILVKSNEFLAMKPLFKWQLAGDFIKIATLVMSYQFLAKKMLKTFVVTEIISLVLFYTISSILIDRMGAEGIVIAHFIRYIVYFFVVVIALRKHVFGDRKLPA